MGRFVPDRGDINFLNAKKYFLVFAICFSLINHSMLAQKMGKKEKFAIVVLPDIQFYTGKYLNGTTAYLNDQIYWIIHNKETFNIAAVLQVGDCSQNGDNLSSGIEYKRAESCFIKLEDPKKTNLKDGIPYSISIGNHDQWPHGDPDGTTNYYNHFFGEKKFSSKNYYGGHYGKNNDNHFIFFNAGKLEFIVISLEYDPYIKKDVLDWADSLLIKYNGKHAILVSHYLLNPNASFGAQGYVIYNRLKKNPNLFLMLCGHFSYENKRTDSYNGNIIHTLLANYQFRKNGGNGWMRIIEFDPANNNILVRSLSPSLNRSENDLNSQFTLKYDFSKIK